MLADGVFADLVGSTGIFERLGDATAGRFVTQLTTALAKIFEQHHGRVVKLLANLNAKVNLIALNPGPGIPFETPGPERVASFQQIVKRGLPCFIRKPRGLDIYAACGQLKRVAVGG